MALQEHAHHPPKTLGESALCFACMAGILLAAAVGLQWVLRLLP
jgi:hypothetical protein